MCHERDNKEVSVEVEMFLHRKGEFQAHVEV